MLEFNNYKSLSDSIVVWYNDNARELPWRKTDDPYIIWISEIILQQTTIRQGLKYFYKFLESFPNIETLSLASEDEVLKLWEGLGYYSRARNLHYTSKHIVNALDKKFPNTYEGLLKLRGIGPYTASAIASFAYNLPNVVVDGNVIRFISRLFGITEAVEKKSTLDAIKNLGSKLLAYQKPSIFNQALMEMGALCCTYKNPACISCPVASSCIAKKANVISEIPLKVKKIVKRKRYFYFFHIIDNEGNTLIQKRKANDIWKGLYQLPLQEVENFEKEPNFKFLNLESNNITWTKSKQYRQTLTHQSIYARFVKINISDNLYDLTKELYLVSNNNKLKKYAWPKILDLYFKDFSITLFNNY